MDGEGERLFELLDRFDAFFADKAGR
jgi:hypothetical protein